MSLQSECGELRVLMRMVLSCVGRLHGAARFAAFVYSSKNGLPLKPSQIHHKMAESEPKLKVFS